MRIIYMFSFFFILIIIQAFYPSDLSAQSNDHYMYTFERLVQEQRYDVAVQIIENNQMAIIQRVAEEKGTYEPIMREYLDKCLSVLRDEQTTDSEKSLAAQQTMILWDAMTSDNAPLWTSWKYELDNKMNKLLDQKKVSQHEMDEIVYYVKAISPVVKLHLNDEQFQDYQQSVSVLANNHQSYNEIELEETFAQISKLNIDTLNNANAHYTKWLIFIVFGFIFLSLSYVAWAKYRGETT
ncbi:sporulation protein YpjB [Gracilibacillus orientalis]|uniref:Sporulation protein YpjB n=1 Tax=Gracilibacillus orientalis TaxID=334253 RepID=A0A1I4L3D8_9BACI|nr:sporulation protein YpjB [Gracilibacillus orientalis]SFL85349.1 sporulation protein YpjB [Gracilibacillus orientalis]